ncbi:glycoside hydrolase [bacterium]|nr:glycoside hydrolase [bacterium]
MKRYFGWQWWLALAIGLALALSLACYYLAPNSSSPVATGQRTDVDSAPTASPSAPALTYRHISDLPAEQTGWTQAVPAEYFAPSDRPGSLRQVTYDAYDYLRDGAPVTKTAWVYLPYGYDDADQTTAYDILYLLHGWGGQAGEFFFVQDGQIKNMFDHLIAAGLIKPMIIVSPTFYTEQTPTDFDTSIVAARAFNYDFIDSLMPAIESQFHTFARSTTATDLADSRDHRAFAGFSLGAVATWNEFIFHPDFIRYFLPMSAACWYFGGYDDYHPVETTDYFLELIATRHLLDRGYFIYAATGTYDAFVAQVHDQLTEMIGRGVPEFDRTHVAFFQKPQGKHNHEAIAEYLYNALPLFFAD